jgi:hypothetical protein
MTKRVAIRFRVTQYANEKPWIVMEPLRGDDIKTFENVVGFDLPANTTFEQAETICRYLNDNLEQFSET